MGGAIRTVAIDRRRADGLQNIEHPPVRDVPLLDSALHHSESSG